jgi:putative SOS response-associated peptidase YedK
VLCDFSYIYQGDYKSHGLSTNNCRLEGLLSSKLYSRPFNKGQRCVVVCDGFYEWQTTKGKKNKQPYFVYMPQDEGVCFVLSEMKSVLNAL